MIVLVGAVAAAGFLWLRSYVFSSLATAIHQKIHSLELSGFKVRYDELSVDWKSNVIEIRGLLLEKNPYDTTCIYPEFIKIDHLRAEGVRLFPLIFDDVLDLETLHLGTPRLHLRRKSQMSRAKGGRESEFALRTDDVFIEAGEFDYTDSASCTKVVSISSNLHVAGLELNFPAGQPLTYRANGVTVDTTRIHLPAEFYTLRLRGAKVDMARKRIELDTLQVIPDFGKYEFGKKRGYETDRFDGIVPYVRIRNFSVSRTDSLSITAAYAELRFVLNIFRDKRLPFREVPKPLPIDILRSLPFALRVDSLKVSNSYVQYEEFPEEATEAGGLFFDNLQAIFTNVNNTQEDGNMHLAARGSLMGRGDVEISVAFPWIRQKRSRLRGSIKNFPLAKINPMLTPSTHLKVESGELHDLAFSFSFDAQRSNGEIEMIYENLKLTSFREEEDGTKKTDAEGNPQKDNLRTFIMNTFIFRKNMNEDLPESKRTGTVAFERDNQRSIFNFWVKSLLSGIKSAYNLDKTSVKKSERQLRKEERLARRLERRIKKAEKRKDRG